MASVSLMAGPLGLPHFSAMSLVNESSGFKPTSSGTPKCLEVTETDHSVRVETDRPHLVSLGGGRLSTAVTIHPLPEGRTYIGKGTTITSPNILVQGTGIEDEHCYIENMDEVVTIHPVAAMVSIDGMRIALPTRLTQGSMICLGRSTFFRFNHPQEAKLIKQILPCARISMAPGSFLPVLEGQSSEEYALKSAAQPSNQDEYTRLPLESTDFVEKVSKFEYMAHSFSPPITSQDTPKWFVREGIRFHSLPWSHSELPKSPKLGPPVPAKPAIDYQAAVRQSRTPEPVTRHRSPIHFWSGRCTPNSPHLNGSYCITDDLKAREEELKLQHRKVVVERLQDENEKRQEQQRLEDILTMCAEYDKKINAEKLAKLSISNISAHNKKTSLSFSSPVTSDFPNNSLSSPKSALKFNSNYSSQNSTSCTGASPHTRIKTNGSLPRERPSRMQNCSSVNDTVDGAMLIINRKALNSASSEDELNAILGENSPTGPNDVFHEDCLSTSPHLGISSKHGYMQSARTGIKTISGKEMSEVYENHRALSDSVSPTISPLKLEARSGTGYAPPKQDPSDKKESPVGDILHNLFTRKMNTLKITTCLKQKISNLEAQESEAIRELELELALVAGEQKEEEQNQREDNDRLRLLQEKEQMLNQVAEKAKKEEQVQLDSAKQELIDQEQLVAELYAKSIAADDTKKAEAEERYRHALEILDAERKAFEDLEFQQLESQTHREEEREALMKEITSLLPDIIKERKEEIEELKNQQKALALQVVVEKELFNKKKVELVESLNEQQEELERIEKKLREAARLPTDDCISSCSQAVETTESNNLTMQDDVWNGNRANQRHPNGDWRSERDAGCQSYHSMESESSSLLSSDVPGESFSSGDDGSRPNSLQTPTSPDDHFIAAEKVRQKEHLLSLSEDKPLVDNGRRSPSVEVKRRDKQKAQRPLTRYLPIRNPEFDLRQHVESAGHQIELCHHVHITATYCKGYLQKLGGKWPSWKKRWFVFDRVKHALMYYSDKTEHKLRGGIYFQSIEEVYVDHLHSVKSTNPHATFCMKTDSRVYYLMAPTPEAMRIWVDVIFTGAEGYLEFLADMDS